MAMAAFPESEILRKQISATICYFDIFSKPLTAFEVWWNLLQSEFLFGPDARSDEQDTSYEDVCAELAEMVAQKKISEKWGFYFLNGRVDEIRERRRRFLLGKKRWDRAVFATRLLRVVPFVRMVAVCNTLAIDAARETSDIDLLIVIRRGRLWMTRLIITLFMHLAGIRRHGEKIAGRICLSFYMTDDALDLSTIALKPFDLYLSYYATHVVCLYENNDTRKKFFEANAWSFREIPHAQPYDVALPRKVEDSSLTQVLRGANEFLWSRARGDALERFVKKIQTSHMKSHPHASSDPVSSKVVISDTMLKFHEEDRREYFYEEFLRRYRAFDEHHDSAHVKPVSIASFNSSDEFISDTKTAANGTRPLSR